MERLKAKVVKLERRLIGKKSDVPEPVELSDEELREFARETLKELEGVPDDEPVAFIGPYPPIKAGDARELCRLMLEDPPEQEG